MVFKNPKLNFNEATFFIDFRGKVKVEKILDHEFITETLPVKSKK
jgi:hypothetical protein